MTVDEAIRFTISGGVIVPEQSSAPLEPKVQKAPCLVAPKEASPFARHHHGIDELLKTEP